MNKNLLPIGSVVLLKDSNKRVMIVGRAQKSASSGKLWDYSSCYYPEGILDPNKLFMFNHDQIDSVFFVGFQDKEGLEYQKYLNEQIDKINEKGG